MNKPAILRALLRENLSAFLQKTFATVSPAYTYAHNWHIDAMAYELEDVLRGDNRRLIITQPPRSLKSISGTGLDSPGWRLPAPALEKTIINGICHFLKDRQGLSLELASDAGARAFEPLFHHAQALAHELREDEPSAQREILLAVLRRATVARDNITLLLSVAALRSQFGLGSTDVHEDIQISLPIAVRRRGVETRLVIENISEPTEPDPKLVSLVVQAHRWFNDLKGRTNVGLHELGEQYGADHSDISRILPLAFLAPDIVEAILDGRQPPELTAARLKRMRDLPLDWQRQRRYLGFE